MRFQKPFPAKLRVVFQDETRIYNLAEEATKDMAAGVLPIKVFKPPETRAERIKWLTWRTSSRGNEMGTPAQRMGYKEKLDAFWRN